MFGIGLPELILIMVLALIVVGPEKLPELAKTLARQLMELKKTANTLKESLQEEMREDELAGKKENSAGANHAPALPEGGQPYRLSEDEQGDIIEAEDARTESAATEEVYAAAVQAAGEEDNGKNGPDKKS